MDVQTKRTEAGALVYGDPGDHARLVGLMRAMWPVLAGVALGGLAAGLLVAARPAAAGGGFLLAAAVFWFAAGRSARRVRAFFKGARGEERVASVLARLPQEFTVFHGVDGGVGLRFTTAGDIDHIVVGPSGIWVVETKCWDAQVEIVTDEIRFAGTRPSRDPVAQVRELTARVAGKLSRRLPGMPPLKALLCFAGSGFAGAAAMIDEVTVCGIDRLYETVAAADGVRLADDDLTRIVEILKQAL